MITVTEEPNALRTDISNGEGTGAKVNHLDQLKRFTTIVADTGDFETDPTKWIIWTLSKLRLVRNLRRVSRDKIQAAQRQTATG